MLVGVAGEHTAQPKILRSTLGFLRLHNECSEMTSTQNLLSHLAWLKDNLPQTPDAVFAVYHAALRLRAETLKDRVPDAILPKTTRRQLNTRVNTLVARSRKSSKVYATNKKSQKWSGKQAHVYVSLSKHLSTVTRFAGRNGLFDGTAIQWPAASQPISFSELVAVVTTPHRDKDPRVKLSAKYQQRIQAALGTLLAATIAEAKSTTTAEKEEAAEMRQVGAAMLAHAGDGQRISREPLREDKVLAAIIRGDERIRRSPSK